MDTILMDMDTILMDMDTTLTGTLGTLTTGIMVTAEDGLYLILTEIEI
jgi:hypothetical protein